MGSAKEYIENILQLKGGIRSNKFYVNGNCLYCFTMVYEIRIL